MIGFYDYTVVVTFVSLGVAIMGMFFSCTGNYNAAVVCLAVSGLCDMFDGKIARTKKNRSEDQKKYGIQLDSLCDIVCFGALPVVLAYNLGMKNVFGIIILILYGICGVIRLAFFNVMEDKRQNEETGNRKYYQGLPITSISVVLPFMYLVKTYMKDSVLLSLYIAMMVTGVLFVVDFKFKKPGNLVLALLVIAVAAALIIVCEKAVIGYFH